MMWMRRSGSFLGLALLLAGCAAVPPARFEYSVSEAERAMVWPAPPETARFRYVGQLTGEENLVRPAQSFNWALRGLRWLVGLDASSSAPRILQRPQGGMTDANGRVFVTDVSRQAVFVFEPAAASLQLWEMADERLRFQMPVAIAAGPAGELWVTDAKLARVVRLNGVAGKPLGGVGVGVLKHPTGIARDPAAGRVYVADRADNAIKVFGDDGALLQTFGAFGEKAGELNGPTYLYWAADRLYVTDSLNSRIQVFSGDGRFLSSFGRRGLFVGDLPRPKGVALDRGGRVYVVESYYDHLLVFDPSGELLLPIGGTGHDVGEFYLPAGVWTDAQDRIYVADTFNGRVVILQYLGAGNEAEGARDSNSAAGGRAAGGG